MNLLLTTQNQEIYREFEKSCWREKIGKEHALKYSLRKPVDDIEAFLTDFFADLWSNHYYLHRKFFLFHPSTTVVCSNGFVLFINYNDFVCRLWYLFPIGRHLVFKPMKHCVARVVRDVMFWSVNPQGYIFSAKQHWKWKLSETTQNSIWYQWF